jgi:Icc-related predicted phosphoesterase
MLFGRKKKRKYTRLFFVTDLHGSDMCFVKVLNAGKIYGADIVIVGGDVTGKMVIPIIEHEDESYATRFIGHDWSMKTQKELEEIERKISDSGFYPYRTTQTEMEELTTNRSKMDEVFKQLILERLRRWLSIAKERLQETDIKLYMTGGNDDGLFIEPVLKEDDFVIDPENEVVKIDEYHEMISLGYANITPWNCPRDIPEDELTKKIDALAQQVRDMDNCIFNIHVPPIESGIDSAPKLDTTTMPPKVVNMAGSTVMAPAGSVAVRKATEKYQPLLGLHGHIHESMGFKKIGRTLCINPGSEYGEGILRGAIVNLEKDRVKGFQFVSG